MEKEKVLEIESKKNNDEYLKKVTDKSTVLAYLVMLIVVIGLLVIDLIEKNPYSYKYLLIVLAGSLSSSIYKYIKIKNTDNLVIIFLNSIAFILHFILLIRDVF